EEQDPNKETLFCLLGKEGLFCGISTPTAAGGIYPGGTKYISQSAEETVSRAGAKVAEALHFISMKRQLPGRGAHWLELGASPGGMTSELLKRRYAVTAIDRASLHPRLSSAERLTFIRSDVGEFIPPRGSRYDAILSDLNGMPVQAIGHVTRLKDFLNPGGLVIFTLKTTGAESIAEISKLEKDVLTAAEAGGLSLIEQTHLTYNRNEFTLFFEKA
ncbi:MAG: hypothetical protein NWR51_00970, partial [Akkermansiaceae bacterium]|nr:hypothetical protein [Akkermansiaceae bacterium]